MNYATLTLAVNAHAALRRRQRLQPVGGKGDKIFPPTYPEERRGAGRDMCSSGVGSTAPRSGACSSTASKARPTGLKRRCLPRLATDPLRSPYLTVDFSGKELAGIGEITSLDAPHRVYDAILRDSLLDGEMFMRSPVGLRLAEAKPADAKALLEVSPTALLFGAWHSTGEGGGLGAKFPRCLVSEIIAVNTPVDEIADQRSGEIEPRTSARRTGSRIDPLGHTAQGRGV